MADANEETSSDETRFDEVLGQYLRRVDDGELLDPEQFIAQHGDMADRLRTYFATADELEQLAGPTTSEESRSPAADHPEQPIRETVPPTGAADGSSLLQPGTSTHSLPDSFGRYRVERELGSGAMGSVYLARDTELDRKVALKVPKFDDDEAEMMERFYREARTAAKIHHRNICPVHDVGEIGGIRYISMAYIEGRLLSDYISTDKRQSEREIALLVRKMALALAEAHEQGVIHRDLKPANVMVDHHGEPVIMDFGLARQIDTQQSRLTQTGTIMGTPIYMSPEQVDGDMQLIGPVSDVYSLGIIFYELLAGRPPFQGSLTVVLAQIVTKEPDPPSKYRPDLDPRLEAICLKMMAKQIPDRYQSMSEAAEALTRFLKQPQTSTSSDPLLQAVAKGDAKLATNAKRAEPASPPADKPTDQPADQPADPSDTLLKQLQQQREKAKELAKRHQYTAAIQILEQIVRQEDPRCQKYVDWAGKEIERLKALPKNIADRSRR